MQALGIDIGGSGIKGAPVDLTTGELVAKRKRIKTPDSSTPDTVTDILREIIDYHGYEGPVGVTLPSVVIGGKVLTAANIDKGWIGYEAAASLTDALGMPVTVINDADAAGLAEEKYGAAKAHSGVCLVLTFGTGIGSALIHNGVLVQISDAVEGF